MNISSNPKVNELNDGISILELANAFGYRELSSKSYRGGTCLIFGDSDEPIDKIMVSKSRNHAGWEHYQSMHANPGSDCGDGAYLFARRALRLNIIPDPLPIANDYSDLNENQKAVRVLLNYLNIPMESRQRLSVNIPKAMVGQPFNQEIADNMLTTPLYTSVFAKRQLTKETFNSPLFKGTWFNCNKDYDSRRHIDDLAFPCMRKDDSIGGINIRYFNRNSGSCSSLMVAGSEHSNTVWHSNVPDKIDQVFIAESEFDCMAHYQLRPNPNTLYISHQGYLIPSQVRTTMDLIAKYKDRLSPDFKLLLGADNDAAGARYDLQFVVGASQRSSDKVEDRRKCVIKDETNEPAFNTMHIMVREDKYEPFKRLTEDYLVKNQIPHLEVRFDDRELTVDIKRPKSDRFADVAVCELLLNSDLLVSNIRREKALEKDWNDDLKVLSRVNEKILLQCDLNMEMDYETYRSLSPQVYLKSNNKEFVKETINQIKDFLHERAEPKWDEVEEIKKNAIKFR